MAWGEWLDLSTIKALSQHTSGTLTAFLCFAIVDRAVKWSPLAERTRSILEAMEQTVLIGLVVWLVWQTALVLWKGRVRNGASSILVAA